MPELKIMYPLTKNMESQPPEGALRPPAGFDECNPKYMCFGNRYHVTKGSLYIVRFITVLALLYTIGNGYAIAVGSDSHIRSTHGDNYVAVVMLTIVLYIVVLGSAFFGLKREKRHYLIPFLVLMAIGCFFLGVAAIVVLSMISKLGSAVFVTLLICIAVDLVNGYCFYIVLLCHDYWGTEEREEEIAAVASRISGAYQTGQQPAPAANVGIPHSAVPPSYDYHQQQPPPMYQSG